MSTPTTTPADPGAAMWKHAVDACLRCSYSNLPDSGSDDADGMGTSTSYVCLRCKHTWSTWYAIGIVREFERYGPSRLVNKLNAIR